MNKSPSRLVRILTFLAVLFAASMAYAETLGLAYRVVARCILAQTPDFDISNPRLANVTSSSSVFFDSASLHYRYVYSFSNSTLSTGAIDNIDIPIQGGPDTVAAFTGTSELGDMFANGALGGRPSIIPINVFVPLGWDGAITKDGKVSWQTEIDSASIRAILDAVLDPIAVWHRTIRPGTTTSGFMLESPVPPGVKPVSLFASWDSTDSTTKMSAAPQVDLPVLSPDPNTLNAATYAGGGQSASANQLMTYVAPSSKITNLPPPLPGITTTKTFVIVKFGNVDPASFHAELDHVDITSKMQAVPNGFGAMELQVPSGRNTLVLKVSGTVNGKSATDQDRLLFIAP